MVWIYQISSLTNLRKYLEVSSLPLMIIFRRLTLPSDSHIKPGLSQHLNCCQEDMLMRSIKYLIGGGRDDLEA